MQIFDKDVIQTKNAFLLKFSRSSKARAGPMRSSRARVGLIWTFMGPYGPVWARMDLARALEEREKFKKDAILFKHFLRQNIVLASRQRFFNIFKVLLSFLTEK